MHHTDSPGKSLRPWKLSARIGLGPALIRRLVLWDYEMSEVAWSVVLMQLGRVPCNR